ncbi:SMI1/KNR4 family protein [Streptomyces sp. NPDC048297]|uniref:SMI1/KNR4 family protein n=1 Tax=Streptomyces sp. NPDC048297 TaxID=3365531 RepID=UPI00372333AC
MVASTDESWTRIESWLSEHAPRTYATLNPPADAESLRAAEEALGLALPPDLVASLLRHDGSGADQYTQGRFTLPAEYGLLGLEGITRQWHMLGKLLASYDSSMVGSWWHTQWVPIAEHVTGDTLFVDQRPGPRQGSVGELLTHDGASVGLWASFANLLEQTAEALETGEETAECAAVVYGDGSLGWE